MRRGITLPELLTIVVVFVVLLAVLIPTVTGVIDLGSRPHQVNRARQIAQAYQAYSMDRLPPRTITTTAMAPGGTALTGTAAQIEDVAFILAKYANFNDGSAWFVPSDLNLHDMTIPRAVIQSDVSRATSVLPAFQNTSPKSWAFVVGMTTSPPQASMMPLLWTYGLQRDGTWVKNSPWQGAGGHIAFLDGHVEWAERITTDNGGVSFAIFSGPDGGKPTVDYLEAMNSQGGNPCQVVNADGKGH